MSSSTGPGSSEIVRPQGIYVVTAEPDIVGTPEGNVVRVRCHHEVFKKQEISVFFAKGTLLELDLIGE